MLFFLVELLFCFVSSLISDVNGSHSRNDAKSILLKLIDPVENRFGEFPDDELYIWRDEAKQMFDLGFTNYMRYAFPMDELDPINCVGRGPDYDNPSNININDVLGDYCLTLIDSLDTLAVFGNISEFHRAVRLVMEYTSFDKDNTVQVFEATIRVLGGLLSAHLLITDSSHRLGDFSMPDYNDELLHMAHDLASRLLPAFEGTNTSIPFPRVNLRFGVPWDTVNETCTSGAGSLLLEFGVLSRLLDDPTFEGLARRTNSALWSFKDPETGLMGNLINIQSGEWVGMLSGLGAGLDSYFEYMVKSYVLFGKDADYKVFNDSYAKIKEHMRRGRSHCNSGSGEHPLYVNVHMHDGTTLNTWIDALQAAFVGVQILVGDIEEAVCAHAVYYNIWKKYGVLPERFNWQLKAPDVRFYPLRPEFAEATYFLYRATKNPFYLHIGKEIIQNINLYTKAKCGYATVHDVLDKSLEDRMESFFLSETCKYLYLLFDHDNLLNQYFSNYIFTTEGHIFPVDRRFRDFASESARDEPCDTRDDTPPPSQQLPGEDGKDAFQGRGIAPGSTVTYSKWLAGNNTAKSLCPSVPVELRYTLPLHGHYMRQLAHSIGVEEEAIWSPKDGI